MTKPREARRYLGVYRRVYMRMWNDERFRNLSKPEPNAQFLWLYLLSGPGTVAAPGVIRATRGGMADELGWTPEAFAEAFRELESTGMAMADWSAGVVFLPKAAFYNPPASINSIKTWATSMEHVTECDLKRHIVSALLDSLSGYSDVFREAYRDAFTVHFTDPGAGAGTGEPLYPLSLGSLPGTLPDDQADPAPLHGAGGSSRSPEGGKSNPSAAGEARVSLGDQSDSTGDGGEAFRLESPEVPTDGRRVPGCVICRDKVPGVMFRRARDSEPFPGEALAAMCWGCASLGCRNDHRLPMPGEKNRNAWKRFEHAFPGSKSMRKRDRERFTSEAAARTRRLFEATGQSAAKAHERQEREAALADVCDHCASALGLLFRRTPEGWEAGLCPECGGSVLYSNPPGFMGPPLPKASANSDWLPWAKTPAAGVGDEPADAWRKAAVDRARESVKAAAGKSSPDPGRDVPEVAPGPTAAPAEEPPAETGDGWDDDVSGEPPPL